MIKRCLVTTALLAAVAAVLTGCYAAPVMPPPGWIFSDFQAPMDIDTERTDIGRMKQGEATSSSILGLVAWGDCSINTAAQSAGITNVHHVDYRFFNVIGIYQTFTTVAYGDKGESQ